MIETIELSKPIYIDDQPVTELSYDIDAVSADQFIEADVLASSDAASKGKLNAKVPELDSSFHFYLGVEAVIAANPGFGVEDVKRIKGVDIRKIMQIGRNFMTAAAGADEEGDSAVQGEDPESCREPQE